MKLPSYSVLMSVYAKEDPLFFWESLQSMALQTHQPGEILLVCDGPLTNELEEKITLFQQTYPSLLEILRLPFNMGLGLALQKGLSKCQNEYILRMDTDDISIPQRAELQLKEMQNNSELVIVGGQIAEFTTSLDDIYGQRIVPISDQEIRKFSKKRNPFNHMTVCYKKSAVLQAGNYQHMPCFEDYWLWIRLLKQGKGTNIIDMVVYARAGKEMIERRKGWSYVKNIWKFQGALLKTKHINLFEFLLFGISRMFIAIAPTSWIQWFYKKFLRKSNTT